jgi:hypothetical protein
MVFRKHSHDGGTAGEVSPFLRMPLELTLAHSQQDKITRSRPDIIMKIKVKEFLAPLTLVHRSRG